MIYATPLLLLLLHRMSTSAMATDRQAPERIQHMQRILPRHINRMTRRMGWPTRWSALIALGCLGMAVAVIGGVIMLVTLL
ncbi:hypothetical protein BZM26_31495 [Paraburkholderia strydomiana]|nr:hypothetical protein BZM26_31495 [Paraburkholderia strydomiana]